MASNIDNGKSEDILYQRIGELVVSFQWIEHLIRQIGWYINDPQRMQWPPTILRSETNHDLLEKVKSIYSSHIKKSNISNPIGKVDDFNKIIECCHKLRRFRNSVLHSTYLELKGGGDIVGILRSNPKLLQHEHTEEVIFDHEVLTEDKISSKMETIANIGLKLGVEYKQLIHLKSM